MIISTTDGSEGRGHADGQGQLQRGKADRSGSALVVFRASRIRLAAVLDRWTNSHSAYGGVTRHMDRGRSERPMPRPQPWRSLSRQTAARGTAARVLLRLSLELLLASAAAAGARADAGVDLELVLAIDSSGSVDFGESELQMGGIANALRDPEVIEAIEGGAPNGVAVAVIEWSGPGQQLVGVDWTRITDAATAAALAARIEAMGRGLIGETAIGEALRFASDLLAYGPFQGARRIIDVSGDGPSNAGVEPEPMRDAAALAGITINGLAILRENPGLDRYYAEHVIGGPDAFVMIAKDYDDFARAIRQKLLREIRGAPLADRAGAKVYVARARQPGTRAARTGG